MKKNQQSRNYKILQTTVRRQVRSKVATDLQAAGRRLSTGVAFGSVGGIALDTVNSNGLLILLKL